MSLIKFQILVLCILVAISLLLVENLTSEIEQSGDLPNAKSEFLPTAMTSLDDIAGATEENISTILPKRPVQKIKATAGVASVGKRITIYQNQDGTLFQFTVKALPNTFSSLELVGDFNFWLANNKPSLVKRYALHYDGNKWATINLKYEDLFPNRTDPIKFKFRGMKASGETVWLPDDWNQSYRGETGNLMLKQRSNATSTPVFSFTTQP